MKPDLTFIIAQILGLFGTVCVFSSYQAKTTKKICIIQIFAGIFFFSQFLVLGAYTAAVLNLVSLVRALVYSSGKKWIHSPLCPTVFSLIFVVATAVFWQGWPSLLPMLALIVTSYSLIMRDPQKARALSLPASPLWFVYDIYTGALVNLINETAVMISIISALIRYRKNKAEEIYK